jgi:hypothetical protein
MKEKHFSTASSPVAVRTEAAGIYIDTQIVEQREREREREWNVAGRMMWI